MSSNLHHLVHVWMNLAFSWEFRMVSALELFFMFIVGGWLRRRRRGPRLFVDKKAGNHPEALLR